VNDESIQVNLGRVEDVCLLIANSSEESVAQVPLEMLQNISSAVGQNPDAVSTSALISGLWPTLLKMESDEAVMSISKCLLHHHIMITNFGAWQWWDGHCSREITAAVLSSVDLANSSWIYCLAHNVRNVIQNCTVSADFSPSVYGISI
jgi:hypothetical protein